VYGPQLLHYGRGLGFLQQTLVLYNVPNANLTTYQKSQVEATRDEN